MLLACAAAAESKRRGPTVFDQPFGQRVMIPYKIVSSDDHMIETASLWEERVPKRFGERAPLLLKNPPGKKGLFFSCGVLCRQNRREEFPRSWGRSGAAGRVGPRGPAEGHGHRSSRSGTALYDQR